MDKSKPWTLIVGVGAAMLVVGVTIGYFALDPGRPGRQADPSVVGVAADDGPSVPADYLMAAAESAERGDGPPERDRIYKYKSCLDDAEKAYSSGRGEIARLIVGTAEKLNRESCSTSFLELMRSVIFDPPRSGVGKADLASLLRAYESERMKGKPHREAYLVAASR